MTQQLKALPAEVLGSIPHRLATFCNSSSRKILNLLVSMGTKRAHGIKTQKQAKYPYTSEIFSEQQQHFGIVLIYEILKNI